ncbi:MAG: 3-deoxy-D-manno-octulosonic acid transferase, partial [Bacteroidetes bacterium]|nr:3-deoxy-D-manno-octulosonic acid transferase [Bacteroidota bacterium]
MTSGQRAAIPQVSAWRKANPDAQVLWMHVASLGEFEQGRPVLERFKSQFPEAKVVLTFYSPSGYEVRKNYTGADLITYLPLDTPQIMETWCSILQPQLMALVKYEVWPNMLHALGKNQIPVVMLSAKFYGEQRFFGLMRNFWKGILNEVTFFHVQDQTSEELLRGLGMAAIAVSGDTRYDRVVEVAARAQVAERYLQWKSHQMVVIFGSSYAFEEEAVAGIIGEYPQVKWVIAPHHIDEMNIQRIEKLYPGRTQRATEEIIKNETQVLLLNTMGDLGGLYQLGEIAVVGGGWGKGIHNILEPAAHGCAVLWGPKAEKFTEAQLLDSVGGGLQVQSAEELRQQLDRLIRQEGKRRAMGEMAAETVRKESGASVKVLKTIAEN